MILDKKSDWFSRVMYKKYIFVSEYIVKLKTRVMLNAMRTFFVFLSVGLLGFLFSVDICAADRVYNVSDFGLKANVKKRCFARIAESIGQNQKGLPGRR